MSNGNPVREVARYLVTLESTAGVRAGDALGEARDEIEAAVTLQALAQVGPDLRAQLMHDGDVGAVVALTTRSHADARPDEERLRRFEGVIAVQIDRVLRGTGALVVRVASDLPAVTDMAGPFESLNHLGPIIATIAAGIGVVGFVTFVGGAVQFGRFAGVGLPAGEAVSVVPTQAMIVLGAETLMPAIVFGLVYTAGLFVVREWGRSVSSWGGIPAVSGDTARGVLLALYVLAAEVIVLLWFDVPGSEDSWRIIGFVMSLIGLPLLVLMIGRRTTSAIWLAATCFVIVGLFTCGLKVVRAWDDHEVRPAAIVRENSKAIIGFYIAEGGGRVYLGQLKLVDPGNGKPEQIDVSRSRIIAVESDQVSDIAIGAAQSPRRALTRAKELADRLCVAQRPRSDDAVASNCWSRPPGIAVDIKEGRR